MTAGGNSLTVYMPRRRPPDDGGISIHAVEQRLIAMLEELDREFGRSRVNNTPEWTSSGARRLNAQQIVYEPQGRRAAEVRAAAFVAMFGGLGGLWFGLNAWSRLPSPPDISIVRADFARVQQGAMTSEEQHVSGASASVTSTPAPAGALDRFDNVATKEEGESPPAASDGGLSIDEFHAQVRRILAERQPRPYDAGLADTWPGGALLPNDTTPTAPDEPRPIAPPSVASPAVSALEMAIAEDLALESVVLAGPAERTQPLRGPIAGKPKAKASTSVGKAPPHKAAVKRVKSQSKEAPQPVGANGPLAIIQGAADALTGAVKEWGRFAHPPE